MDLVDILKRPQGKTLEFKRRADRELIDELRRLARGEALDEQPMPGLDSEALDFRAASESFVAVRKLTRRDLETLRLVTDDQGRKVLAVGRMVLFGDDRGRHFPDAWNQAGRFGGTDKSRIVDRLDIRSYLVRPVEKAIAFVEKQSIHGAEIGPVPALDETDQTIMSALPRGKGLLTDEIAKAIGLTPLDTRTRLARLVGSGLLREVGTGPQDPKRGYFRTE